MLIQPWRIDMLGGFRLSSHGQEVHLRSNLLTRLLSYLAIHANRFHPRDELVTLLWPDDDPAVTRGRLRVALNSLRHHVEPPGVASGAVLIADRLAVRLNPSAFSSDVNQFQAAFVEAFETDANSHRLPLLVAAADGYGGPLLPAIDDDWVMGERERLAQSYLQTLHRLVRDLVSVRDYERALVYARYAVQTDNFREEAYRDMMHLFVALGQPLKALQQYQDLKRVLSDALHISPSATTVQLASQIAERVGLGSPEIVPATQPPKVIAMGRPRAPTVREESGYQGNIPVFLTRFFGRKSELDALEAALQPAELTDATPTESDFTVRPLQTALPTADEAFTHRLVTLTGPGGTGKTRLAVQAATRLLPVYDHRICFIPLADIADARRLPAIIAAALGLPRESKEDPLVQVFQCLRERRCLLVLDNFEHLVEGGADVLAELIAQVSSLTCLITSRRSLGLAGEKEIYVPPLPVPPGTLTGAERAKALPVTPIDIVDCTSVQLFVDRARNCLSHFQITSNNASDVALLCRRLEGIPLALELAAARARVLTPGQMLAQLERRFDVLVNPRSDKSLRHRSLRATLEWSLQLLSPDLRKLFVHLSIFRGGWSLEAAERICDGMFVLEGLEQLQMDSLITTEETLGQPRFRMLETLREFGLERLPEDERRVPARRHSAYFLALAEEARPHLRGPEQAIWFDRLDAEHENLEAVFEWCTENAEGTETGLRLAYALERFWFSHGYLKEGRKHVEAVLSNADPSIAPQLRAPTLNTAGSMAFNQTDYPAARAYWAESLALYRLLNDRLQCTNVLANLAGISVMQHQYAEAKPLCEEALAEFRLLDCQEGICRTLNTLCITARMLGDFAEARRYGEESLVVARNMGNPLQVAVTLGSLGSIAFDQGDYASACTLQEEGLQLHRRLGSQVAMIPVLSNLGLALGRSGQFERSRACHLESLVLSRQNNITQRAISAIDNLGEAALYAKKWEYARWLNAVADAERQHLGIPIRAGLIPERESAFADIRAAIGDAKYEAAVIRGQAISFEEAMDQILSGYTGPSGNPAAND